MKYSKPEMEIVMLPTAAVFTTISSGGNGDDTDPNPIDFMGRGRGAWLEP